MIKEYYTRDEAQLCVDHWNSLPDVDRAEHLLTNSNFYKQYCKSCESLQSDAELEKTINSPEWPFPNLK